MDERRAELMRRISQDPELSKAAAIIAGAKEEAGKIVKGDDPESKLRRSSVQSKVLSDIIIREGLNGKPRTNREIPEESTSAV